MTPAGKVLVQGNQNSLKLVLRKREKSVQLHWYLTEYEGRKLSSASRGTKDRSWEEEPLPPALLRCLSIRPPLHCLCRTEHPSHPCTSQVRTARKQNLPGPAWLSRPRLYSTQRWPKGEAESSVTNKAVGTHPLGEGACLRQDRNILHRCPKRSLGQFLIICYIHNGWVCHWGDMVLRYPQSDSIIKIMCKLFYWKICFIFFSIFEETYAA